MGPDGVIREYDKNGNEIVKAQIPEGGDPRDFAAEHFTVVATHQRIRTIPIRIETSTGMVREMREYMFYNSRREYEFPDPKA